MYYTHVATFSYSILATYVATYLALVYIISYVAIYVATFISYVHIIVAIRFTCI